MDEDAGRISIGPPRLRSVGPVPAVLEAVIIGLVTTQVAFVVTTVYLHRSLAHRAVKLKPPVAFACRVVIWMATGTRPRQWVAVHRKHHAFTDKDGDPHSPAVFGFSAVQFGNAVLYRRVARKPDQVARYARDLPPTAGTDCSSIMPCWASASALRSWWECLDGKSG